VTVIETLRPALSGLGAAASLANGFLFVAAAKAEGQTGEPSTAPTSGTTVLPAIEVEAPHKTTTTRHQATTNAGSRPAPRPIRNTSATKPTEQQKLLRRLRRAGISDRPRGGA